MNWDDLKFALAVAEAGSVNAAARQLGVNHATVLRRIAQLEGGTGVQIFDREHAGYRVTRDGERVVAAANRMRMALQAMDRSLTGPSDALQGQIRITTTETLMVSVVGPALRSFQQRYPAITIELSITNQLLNLNRGHIDVAIRPTRLVPEGMHATRVSALGFGAYASAEYLEAEPHAPGPDTRWLVIDPTNMASPTEYWMRTHYPHANESVRADSFMALGELAGQGQGVAVLPCCLGGMSPSLIMLGEPLADIETSLWVMTHNDMVGAARIAVFCEHMHKSLADCAPLVEGRIKSSRGLAAGPARDAVRSAARPADDRPQ